MSITLELSAEDQANLSAKAQEVGLPLEGYVSMLLHQLSRESAFPELTRSQIAGQQIRELRKHLKQHVTHEEIREMIEEGRE